jgi:hypothetical protein
MDIHRARITKKVSEFAESLDSHSVYDHNTLAQEFKDECGAAPGWRTKSAAEVRKEMKKRGLGGWLEGIPTQRTVSGVEVVEWLARKYVPTADFSRLTKLMGLGSRFREALRILKEADL